MTTTLSIRIEEKTKKEAKKTLEALGLDLSSAVKMFLTQVVTEQGMPFKSFRIPQLSEKKWKVKVARFINQGRSISEVERVRESFIKKKKS